jgi:hypothetical protein
MAAMLDRMLGGVVITLLLSIVALGVWLAWSAATAEAIELPKAEWTCAETVRRTRLQPLVVGKIVTQQPVVRTECVVYRRKDAP